MTIKSFLRASAIGAVALTGTMASAELDLAGETVEWIIPFSETGGSARWANFYAPLLSEALPGNPTVVVTFMPGAGSTTGANHFQGLTYEDGTTLFGSSGSTQFPYLLGDPRVRYEYKDWNVVLASGTGGVAYLPPALAEAYAADPASLNGENLIYGAQSATGLDLVPLLAWEMLGLNVEPVFGIEGRGDGRLMFERGEANIDYQTSSSYLSGVAPLVDDDGNIVRDPTFPDMPSFKEVCEANPVCETSGTTWDAWKAFFVAGFPAQKMVFLANGAPDEAIETFTKAFASIKDRPDYAEISKSALGLYPQLTGKGAQTAKADATSVPDEAREFVKTWLLDSYGVVLE
jgi:hypothetical protein